MRSTLLRLRRRGVLSVGDDVVFGGGARILSPTRAVIGDRVRIGRDFHAETDFEIGDDVLVSSRVAFVGNDHPIDVPQTVFSAPRSGATSIKIGSDVLIGFGSIIVGDVEIGDGCVVGAGAVVTSSLPGNSVCVGVPARPIRQRRAV